MLETMRSGAWLDDERLVRYPLIIALIAFIGLVILWTGGPTPLTDRLGKPIGSDFSGVWTAGRMLLEGNATGLFDPAQHFAYQQQVHGNADIHVYGWHYPPFFLAVAALLATMPYLMALLVWQAATLGALLVVLNRIIPDQRRLVTVAALGFPATMITIAHGHNAFLSAALIGGGLVLLDRRPILAGILIGFLAYKPQFGLVLPLVLALGGHWRAFVSAGATVVAMAALSTLLLGPEVWTAFIAGAAFTRDVVLEQGATGWFKIQSAFSAVRAHGGSLKVAYLVQGAVTLAVMVTLALAVLRGADKRLVAAMTATAALLATPYCMDYDMAILSVAIAFAVSHGLERGFAAFEKTVYAAAWAVPLLARSVMKLTGLPLGLTVMLALFIVLAHRAIADTAGASTLTAWRQARGTPL